MVDPPDDDEPEEPEVGEAQELEDDDEEEEETELAAAIASNFRAVEQRIARVEQELGIRPTAEHYAEPAEDWTGVQTQLADMFGRFRE